MEFCLYPALLQAELILIKSEGLIDALENSDELNF